MIKYVVALRDMKSNTYVSSLLVGEDEVESLKRQYGILVNGKDEVLTMYAEDFDLCLLFKLDLAEMKVEVVDSLLFNLGALKKNER